MRSLISPRWLLGVAGVMFAALPASGAAALTPAEAELAKKFSGVTQWQGIYDVAVNGAASRSGANGFHLESRYEATGHGTFTLERGADDGDDAARGVFTWQGKGEVRGGGAGTFSEWDQRGVGEEWSQEFGGTAEQERIEFSLSLGKKLVSLHPGLQRQANVPLMRRTGRMVSAQSGGGNKTSAIEMTFPAPIDVWYFGSGQADDARRWQVVSSGPGVLAFTHESAVAGRSQKFEVSGAGVVQRSRVLLFPVYEELEVEVTIADYAKWRPLGSIPDPKKPGNTLVARAMLKIKSGKPKAFPAVKAFRFQLLDTSREPGVCLNWPLNAKDDDYDLRLAVAGTAGDLSAREQKLTVTSPPVDAEQRPFAEATVESYDFGGRASLLVVCELEDGREIIGLMKDESGKQDLVRLPKMQGPDWIAEAWRKEKKVEKLTALADDEKVEGQKHNGDGYTLYEEYRGWAVEGRHVEGDPERKDFFVLNLIGADGRPGIALFENVSELRVHSKLRRSEMSQATRLMNGNHRDGPRRVNQHGVWVKTFTLAGMGNSGANTPMTKAGVAGRPGITKGVGILARGDKESLFNQPLNLPAQDAIFAYDRAIAHELLHSVGVEHHGEDDERLSVWWVSPRHPRNKIGRPYFRGMNKIWGEPDVVHTLLDEQGHDLATQFMATYARDRTNSERQYREDLLAEGRAYIAARPGMKDLPFKTAEAFAEYRLEETITHMFLHQLVGMPRGPHSGDQDCLMRYYFADFYRKTGAADTFYRVTPGSERIGMELCRSGAGTGINAASHKPQSRYFNAAGDAGNCFNQICPNDAVPPRKTK